MYQAARLTNHPSRMRRMAVLVFLLAPKTGPVVLAFSVVMGLTFLSTVPPTAGLVPVRRAALAGGPSA